MRKNLAFVVLALLLLALQVNAWATESEQQDGDFRYIVSSDGVRLYYQAVPPVVPVKGAFVVLSGLGGAGRDDFQAFARKLAEEGYYTYLAHQRGTGLSGGKRGDIEDVQILVDDYKVLLNHLRGENPGLPLFLLGHSLGGAFSLRLAAERGAGLAGVILVNPTYLMKGRPSIWQMLSYSFNYMFRRTALTVEMQPNPETIQHSGDRAEVTKARTDSWVVSRSSIRYMMEVKKIMDASEANATQAEVPLLLIYGEKDQFIDHSGSERIYKAWDKEGKEMYIIPGGGHGAHVADEIVDTVLTWLRPRVRLTK